MLSILLITHRVETDWGKDEDNDEGNDEDKDWDKNDEGNVEGDDDDSVARAGRTIHGLERKTNSTFQIIWTAREYQITFNIKDKSIKEQPIHQTNPGYHLF